MTDAKTRLNIIVSADADGEGLTYYVLDDAGYRAVNSFSDLWDGREILTFDSIAETVAHIAAQDGVIGQECFMLAY